MLDGCCRPDGRGYAGHTAIAWVRFDVPGSVAMEDRGGTPGRSQRIRVPAVLISIIGFMTLFLSYSGPPASGADPSPWQLVYQPDEPTSISCASASICVAVSDTSTPRIVTTTDAGSTWSPAHLPAGVATGPPSGPSSVACPSTTVCFAVGNGIILYSDDGGADWVEQTPPSGAVTANDITCPTVSVCYAVGDDQGSADQASAGGMQTSDGGSTWTTMSIPGDDYVLGVVCFSASSCDVGYQSFMATTADGGATWSLSQSFSPPPEFPTGFGCSTLTQCYVSGADITLVNEMETSQAGVTYATTNGGASWSQSTDSDGYSREGQSCPTATTCNALGYPSGVSASPLTSLGSLGQEPISDAGVIVGPCCNVDNVLETGISCPTTLVCFAVDGQYGIYKAAAPGVTAQPSSQFYSSGQSLTFNATATGVPAPTVQWQYSFNGGTTWANLSGATSNPLTVGPLNGFVNNWQVRAVFTNAFGSATSDPATMSLASTSVVLPSNGATLSGITQYLDATASSGVTQVQYELTGGSLNNHVIATATPTYVGWAAAWNTTTVANGTYTLNSVASYPGGVTVTSPPVSFTVNNPPASTTVVYPASGATVSTTQTQFYDAVASVGVTAVQIELTGAAETSTLDAIPTIYGWIASIPGETCVPPPEGGCADVSFPETVQSVASYSNGLTGMSPPVSITIVAEIPIGV